MRDRRVAGRSAKVSFIEWNNLDVYCPIHRNLVFAVSRAAAKALAWPLLHGASVTSDVFVKRKMVKDDL
jgi:hypothetical protein